MEIALATGDYVITAFNYRDKVLIITKDGQIFVLEIGHGFEPDQIIISRL